MTQAPPSKREVWLDLLRIASAFLVIVNHTNSRVFQQTQPGQAVWWLSLLWYYVSKLAVPLFVMVSGACLLNRRESWTKALSRALRVLCALLVFAYLYFLHDAWVHYGLWPRMLRLDLLLADLWTQQVSDGFWYLYFYMGLMLMLPLLQKLAHGMQSRDYAWLIGLCLALDGLWPLLAHYLPGLALPSYMQTPLYTGYLGLFFAGHWIRQNAAFSARRRALIGLAASLAFSLALTYLEVFRVGEGEKYWFMDDRLHPSLFTCTASLCAMTLFKGAGSRFSGRACRAATELGGCAFGVYLLQDWLIAQTKTRLFAPLRDILSPFPAVLIWEAAVFALGLALSFGLRHLPGFKRIL